MDFQVFSRPCMRQFTNDMRIACLKNAIRTCSAGTIRLLRCLMHSLWKTHIIYYVIASAEGTSEENEIFTKATTTLRYSGWQFMKLSDFVLENKFCGQTRIRACGYFKNIFFSTDENSRKRRLKYFKYTFYSSFFSRIIVTSCLRAKLQNFQELYTAVCFPHRFLLFRMISEMWDTVCPNVRV